MNINLITITKKRIAALSCIHFLLCALFSSNQVRAQTFLTGNTLSAPITAGEYYHSSSITLSPGFSFAASSGNSLHFYIVPTGATCVPLAAVPSPDQNYVSTLTLRLDGFTSNTQLTGLLTCQAMQSVQYIDGLGRPFQSVTVKGNPDATKDVIQPEAYDPYGREAVKYLPYTTTTGNPGAYRGDALTGAQNTFYQQTGQNYKNIDNPFAVSVFEPSPLNRVTEQGAPGSVWQPASSRTTTAGRTIATDYTVNADSEVLLWIVNSGGASASASYGANTLSKTITKDENWVSGKTGTTEEFKDQDGHVVLKRTWESESSSLSTYYIYNDLNNLVYVVPPAVTITSFAESDAVFGNFIYGYHYDTRSRMIEKKIPGKDWEYLVYNKLDQPVATQDAVQRGKATQEWTFTKYDGLGRVACSGIYQYPGSSAGTNYRAALQSTLDGQTTLWENPTGSGIGYGTAAWPQANITQYLSLNYYDNYTFPGNPYSPVLTTTLSQPIGLLTAAKTATLQPDGTYGSLLWSVNYYDEKGRIIETYKQHYLGGESTISTNNYDQTTITYDFTNAVVASTRKHYVNSSGTANLALTIADGNTYDHEGRKLQATNAIAIGNNPLPAATILSKATYNEVGQLYTKQLHSTNSGSSFLQQVSYGYNERGWLAAANSNGNLFNLALNYNTTVSGITPQFNGNIEQMLYTGVNSGSKTFAYIYDPLNRLTTAASTGGTLDEGISYDKMGNITALARGGTGNGSLSYSYTAGNQLSSVSGYTSRSYAYDANGNATSDGGSKSIAYNMLDLPGTVSTSGSTSAIYAYDASGQKLRNTGTDGSWDYIDGIVYHNGAIAFVATEEGRAVPNGGSYNYQYNLKDHLGNDCLSFDANPSDNTARVLQEDEYYSFGLRKNLYDFSNNNRYLYNGKEIQTDLANQYDYGARFYDPVIGRWTTVDPLAELGRRETPYGYAFDDPMRFTDPDGMWPDWGDVVAFAKQVVNTARNLSLPGSDVGNRATKEGLKAAVNTAGTMLAPLDATNRGGHMKRGSAQYKALQEEGKRDVKAAITTAVVAVATDGFGRVAGSMLEGVAPEINVFRVSGGDAKADGYSWTPTNPNSVANFRDAAGLPSGGESGMTNTAESLTQGMVKPSAIIKTKAADALDGNKGGLSEYIINPKNVTNKTTTPFNPIPHS